MAYLKIQLLPNGIIWPEDAKASDFLQIAKLLNAHSNRSWALVHWRRASTALNHFTWFLLPYLAKCNRKEKLSHTMEFRLSLFRSSGESVSRGRRVTFRTLFANTENRMHFLYIVKSTAQIEVDNERQISVQGFVRRSYKRAIHARLDIQDTPPLIIHLSLPNIQNLSILSQWMAS